MDIGILELLDGPAHLLARAIRTKVVSTYEVVRACCARIEAVNPRINAVAQLDQDAALDQARRADEAVFRGAPLGPFHGVPITVKDTLDAVGLVHSAGTKGRSSYFPQSDATAVARMRRAGAIILGKTNVPELGLSFETDNVVHGCTNNPYDLAHTPGGSSGGEAAIIGAGGSPFGLGSDQAGSIRIPAHFCGVAGIKPTSGRIPRTGHFPPALGVGGFLVQIGPLARFVRDLSIALPILSGADWRDPAACCMPALDAGTVDLKRLRVAFHDDNGIHPPTTDTVRVLRAVAEKFSRQGIEVEEQRPARIDESYDLMISLLSGDTGEATKAALKAAGTEDVHPAIRKILAAVQSQTTSASHLCQVLMRLDEFRSAMLRFFETFDAILCPACAFPAPLHGATFIPNIGTAFSYAMTYNLTGWPAAVVRAGSTAAGLPIGVQVVAHPGRDDIALAIAQHIESTFGGWHRPGL